MNAERRTLFYSAPKLTVPIIFTLQLRYNELLRAISPLKQQLARLEEDSAAWRPDEKDKDKDASFLVCPRSAAVRFGMPRPADPDVAPIVQVVRVVEARALRGPGQTSGNGTDAFCRIKFQQQT